MGQNDTVRNAFGISDSIVAYYSKNNLVI